MPNFLVHNNVKQKTANPATPIVTAPNYEPRALFSISASNQLQGTLWIVKNGIHLTTDLGPASFLIRDQDGNTIGITESGIVADANGLYIITPVLADAIQDLTHYTVELTITAESQLRKGVVGITLGE
jgi:hypothetical protein